MMMKTLILTILTKKIKKKYVYFGNFLKVTYIYIYKLKNKVNYIN